MKTLKQFYKEEEIKEDSNLRTFTQDHIEATKKWLTQKQAKYLTQKDWELSIRQVFDELLEELNQ